MTISVVDGVAHYARVTRWPNGRTWSVYLYCLRNEHHKGLTVHEDPPLADYLTCMHCAGDL